MNQHQISNRAKAREGRSREDREDEGAHPDGLRLGVATCEEWGRRYRQRGLQTAYPPKARKAP